MTAIDAWKPLQPRPAVVEHAERRAPRVGHLLRDLDDAARTHPTESEPKRVP